MGWPQSQEYNEAIQDPAACFADAELRLGVPTLGPLGLPLPRSGNFADVYELDCPATGNRWAVKCFTRQVAGLRERYAAVSTHLGQARLPFAVDFQLLERGIRVLGQWYPVLKMRWVEGLLLNEFARDCLDKPGLLQALSQIWARMGRRLREANLAHGDLQHGNVILVPGRTAQSLAVKLIDYDGMWVPALADRRSGEVGHPNYQHPRRLREGIYGPEVDRFPLLVVATALRALAAGGRELWERYDNGDNLLFREVDLRSPDRSPLFTELHASPDREVRELVERLHEASALPPDEVPLLDEPGPERPAVATAVTANPPPAAVVQLTTAPSPARARAALEELEEVEPVEEEDQPRRRRRPRSVRVRRRVPVWLWATVGGGVLAVWVAVAVAWLAVRGRGGDRGTAVAVAPDVPPPEKNPPPVVDKPRLKPPPGVKEVPVKEPPARPPEPMPGAPRELFRLLGNRQQGGAGDLVVMSTGEPGGWQLYDWRRQRESRRFPGPGGPLTCFATTPDGRLAVTSGPDKMVHVWDVAQGNEITTLRDLGAPAVVAALSPAGDKVFADDGVGHGLLWGLPQKFARHSFGFKFVRAFTFAPDGNHIALAFDAGGPGDRGNCWFQNIADPKEPRPQVRMSFPPLSALAFSPDGGRLVAGVRDRSVRMWDLKTGNAVWEARDMPAVPHSVVFSPDGTRVLVEMGDEARVLESRLGHGVRTIHAGPGGLLTCAFGGGGEHVFALELRNGRVMQVGVPPEGAPPVVQGPPPGNDPGGNHAIPGTPRLIYRLMGDSEDRLAMAEPGSPSWGVHIPSAGALKRHFPVHKGAITAFASSPGGVCGITGADDGSVRIAGLTADFLTECVALPPDPAKHFTAVAVTDDGNLAAWGRGTEMALWKKTGNQTSYSATPTGRAVTALALSRDGGVLAYGLAADDRGTRGPGVVVLEDVQNRQTLGRLEGGDVGIPTTLAFNRDGSLLAVGEADGRVHLLDRAGRLQASGRTPAAAPVEAITFQPGGSAVLAVQPHAVVVFDGSLRQVFREKHWPETTRVAADFNRKTQGVWVVTEDRPGARFMLMNLGLPPEAIPPGR
jgi:WD40 repeat protein